ncbi:MAG TPA: TIGR01777 family oxidoreductase [Pyrinomonadaceae bacterium]|jgi:uncharacterized protein (TIGR01777 family)|nr:TIGR01777 family oxidoreductase [Pyrinomonadaceae bacterium]
MKILISGATGLIAKHLIPALEAKGHEIFSLIRKEPRNDHEIRWDAEEGFTEGEQAKLEGMDAVLHLAGEPIGQTWTKEKKRLIKESRTVGTRVLVSALDKTKNPPKHFISASAIGYYGNRGDEILTEESTPGEGFLPEICVPWEAEARKAADFGARVIFLRTGIVLSKDGGALAQMLTPFSFGVGGVVGGGTQWMSWIALEDMIGAILFALENENVRGAINVTAPNPVTNQTFTKTLGEVLNRPTFIPIPEFGVKFMFGEMGETLLLGGSRVIPKKLQDLGFTFKYPELKEALKKALE